MSVTFNAVFNAGSSRTGLVGRVAYSTDGGSTWTSSGFAETLAGSGIYSVAISLADGFAGKILYKTGDADRVSSTLTLTAAGTGYTNGTGYALTFTGGGGTGAAGTFDVVNGAVTNLILTNQGSGYTSAPTITFTTAGAGTGATATASLVQPRYAGESVDAVVILGGFQKYQISGTVQDASPTAGGFIVAFGNGFTAPQTNILVGRQLAFTSGGNYPDKQQITGYTWLSTTTARLTFSNPFAGSPANGDPWNIL